MREIKAGSTSQSTNIFIADSSSTTGAGKSALAFNTSGLTAYYSFTGAAATSTAITLATLATVTTAWASGGFKELDATNMTGFYRFDIPNAALASGNGPEVVIHFQGAAGMAPAPVKILLTGWDNQDGVRGGLTGLANAVPGAAGGLFIAGTNAATTVTTSFTTTFTGNVTGSVGSVVSATIKKNTALANFEFMMTDSTNHAPVTGKTVTCTRSIDGGTFAAGTLANVAEVAFGMYRVDFATGDLNGNVITLRATATGSDDTFVTVTTNP